MSATAGLSAFAQGGQPDALGLPLPTLVGAETRRCP